MEGESEAESYRRDGVIRFPVALRKPRKRGLWSRSRVIIDLACLNLIPQCLSMSMSNQVSNYEIYCAIPRRHPRDSFTNIVSTIQHCTHAKKEITLLSLTCIYIELNWHWLPFVLYSMPHNDVPTTKTFARSTLTDGIILWR